MNISNLFKLYNWVVVGDVTNQTKYAYRILNTLKSEKYNAAGVNPRGNGDGAFTSLKEVNFKIEVIDLCINPVQGLEIIKEAKDMGIKNVLIQPGAESEEILTYCKENEINAIEGCVLRQLGY
ncbi:CoA-binding protein [Hathewaya histolytica]|uniref:Putative CoA-binding protein n=1 Tax=Hathewaya histolytica TaxID=1498 RepID=A0A4U9RTD4_HATHI|nr:CoA-binding protein [Hathewaya histolytica]VTQ92270.1 putative CoA-binding protein [Hathewaya histolytica]